MDFSVSNRGLVNTETGSRQGPTAMALLMDDDRIYAYVFGHWHRSNEEPANPVAVAVGPGGIWCLDSAGCIHKWNEQPADSEWIQDTVAENVTTLTCDDEGTLWYTNQNGELYFSSINLPAPGSELQHMNPWTKAAFERAWFFGDSWQYTTGPDDHLLNIVRTQYKVTDVDTVYHIADEIVRLSNITKKWDGIQPGQTLTMPPLGYR